MYQYTLYDEPEQNPAREREGAFESKKRDLY